MHRRHKINSIESECLSLPTQLAQIVHSSQKFKFDNCVAFKNDLQRFPDQMRWASVTCSGKCIFSPWKKLAAYWNGGFPSLPCWIMLYVRCTTKCLFIDESLAVVTGHRVYFKQVLFLQWMERARKRLLKEAARKHKAFSRAGRLLGVLKTDLMFVGGKSFFWARSFIGPPARLG